ncbi:hypothetical protein C0Q70_16161 [Pomacea canaliculata]|uniref:Peroxisomal membrane protein PEX13 n=1 Tax=Pomacea canaliculata TaxID=400727 RepID=A0A2T7NP01_POMCA|nr:peroxisomal membrane protein PEX13-like isoform X2 [Pomacea canaliculata]PVD22901.1 hypothetical protein C0Q70_16161 [Pomacea canaliculata]
MAAPLKPWERPGINHQNSSSVLGNNMSRPPDGITLPSGIGASPAVTQTTPPPLPPRPSTNISRFGSSYGGYSSFGGPFGYSGGMYSPYSGFGGYGPYGYNRFGSHTDISGSSFARVAEENSRPAFQSIESIVQAFTSVSMMLDSSFQAVYSSFRAVIGVADNFSRLRTQLMQIFSALAFIRTLRYFVRRLLEFLRLRPPGEAEREWKAAVQQVASAVPAGTNSDPKKSSWPIFMFFGIILGGPWLIWKLISSFSSSSQQESWAKGEVDHYAGQALYNFSARSDEELSFSAGQHIIIAPKEQQPQVRGWLLASVDGQKTGLVPATYIKVLGQRQGVPSNPTAKSSATQPAGGPSIASPVNSSGSCPSLAAPGSSPGNNLSSLASIADMDAIFSSSDKLSLDQASAVNFRLDDQNPSDLEASDILDQQADNQS